MKRRPLIKLAALSLAGLVLPLAKARTVSADAVFRELFGDDRVAAHLGRLHLRQDPMAGARGRSILADLAAASPTSRETDLRARSQAELAALEVVTVDGWVLARSEADLCAAVFLGKGTA